MALNNIYSLSSNSDGFAVTSGSGSAWALGSFVEMTTGLSKPIAVIGFSCVVSMTSGTPAALNTILDLAIGASGFEIVKIQFPSNPRGVTLNGYVQQATYDISLPEPFLIPEGTRISVRGSVNDATGGISMGNIKIFYYEKELSNINNNFLSFF